MFVSCTRITLAVATSLTLLANAPAFSGQRTFVASTGVDTNPCTLMSPCRTFAAAILQVSSGGEVVVLDSAGYGPFTIAKSVTITAPSGTYAGISVVDGDGVTINAGAGDSVTLRNLTIVGFFPAKWGIQVSSVGHLTIEGLHVSGFNYIVPLGGGLKFFTSGSLRVTNSTFVGNSEGIDVSAPASSSATAVIQDTNFAGNYWGYTQGFFGPGTVHASIVRSNASENAYGFGARGGAADVLVLESCIATANAWEGVWLTANGGALVLSGNSITGNTKGVLVDVGSAIAQTRGNNTIVQNGSDVDGTLVSIPGGGT